MTFYSFYNFSHLLRVHPKRRAILIFVCLIIFGQVPVEAHLFFLNFLIFLLVAFPSLIKTALVGDFKKISENIVCRKATL